MHLTPLVRYLATVVAIAGGLTAISLAAVLVQPGEAVSLIYPATGLAAAILWGYGFRWWPALAAAQFVLSYRASSGSVAVSTFVAATELLVVLLFCSLVARSGVTKDLERLRDLAMFVAAAFAASLLGGAMSIVGERLIVPATPVDRILTNGVGFWLSDLVSLLVFVPLVMSWRRWPFAGPVQVRRFIVLSMLLVVGGLALALAGRPLSMALFLLLPIVVFISLAAGMPGASAAGAYLLFILLGLHIGEHPTRTEATIRLLFVGTAIVTGYVLAILWRERERGAQRLFYLAHHDPLTGMSNRHELERQLEEAVGSGAPSAHALLYLDLDQFKLVNDTCGHMAGDRMLQELSAELRSVTPPGSLLARLGGDEFACLMLDATEREAEQAANVIHEAAARYRFRFGAMSFPVGASIGITFFPAEADTAAAVLGRADIACHLAKEDGGHRTHVYRPRDEAMLRWHSTVQEVSQLEHAIADGRLQLYSQRIVDIAGGSVDFHEVLLRYVDDQVLRTSSEFLPVAQRFGLMDRIDRWVLESTCRHLAESGDRDVRLSVNLSGSTLDDPSFYQSVIDIQKRYDINPRQICLEVTEGLMIHRLRRAVEAMKELRARGFDLALDDFGAGVASFAYLQELPVTYVKLDGRITSELTTDPASEVIIGSLVKLARLRNIECIAEWADSDATIERLRALGVRYAQGFFIEEPVPLNIARGREPKTA